jgi:hypothetical protein
MAEEADPALTKKHSNPQIKRAALRRAAEGEGQKRVDDAY